MAVTATPKNDRETPWKAVDEEGGVLRVTRSYYVNTGDEVAARSAAGLPTMGQALDLDNPLCIVRNISTQWQSGPKSGPNVENGRCLVVVEYASKPPGGGSAARPAPADGFKWREQQGQVRQVQVRYSIDAFDAGATGDEVLPIANGDGTSRDVGLTIFNVNKYMKVGDLSNTFLGLLIQLQEAQAVNNNSVTLPPVRGGSQNLVAGAGTLRYLNYQVGTEILAGSGSSGIVLVQHQLAYASDHLFRWVRNDLFNKAQAGVMVQSRLYEEASFTGIF